MRRKVLIGFLVVSTSMLLSLCSTTACDEKICPQTRNTALQYGWACPIHPSYGPRTRGYLGDVANSCWDAAGCGIALCAGTAAEADNAAADALGLSLAARSPMCTFLGLNVSQIWDNALPLVETYRHLECPGKPSADGGAPVPDAGPACADLGQRCNVTVPGPMTCCPGLVCDITSSPSTCCYPTGSACLTDDDCCPGFDSCGDTLNYSGVCCRQYNQICDPDESASGACCDPLYCAPNPNGGALWLCQQ